MNFQQGLQAQLDADPALRKSAFGRRVLRVFGMPAPRRARILKRMESHSRVQLGKSQTQAIDWGKIDWPSVLEMLIKLLPLLLLIL